MVKIIVIFNLLVLSFCVSAQITETGLASFYDDKFQGRVTASGELFDHNKLTAAHRTFPFGTIVKVVNLENKKELEIRINDRGPFVNNRLIDVSAKAAKELGFYAKGTTKVRIEVLKLGVETPANNSTLTENKTEPKTEIKTGKVIENQTPSTVADTKSTIASEALEYYRLESERVTPAGFAIQIASYQEAANLMKLCSELKSKMAANILVQVSENQDKKVYRVMVGPFENRAQAEEWQSKLSRQFTGCFVIAL